ncbi:MAG: hypothetical protein ABIA75_14450 [Candidatus Neomarinimicrobiota bacterium]
MKRRVTLLFIGLLGTGLAADSAILDSVHSALYRQAGSLVDMEIIHRQYGQDWLDRAQMEIVGVGRYLLDTPEQLIKVDKTVIQTWNKGADQLIIDQVNPNEVSILNILTGDFSLIEVVKSRAISQVRRLEFRLPAAEISGEIVIGRQTNLPEEIIIFFTEDDRIRLLINKIEPLSEPSRFANWQYTGKDIIDLRE